MQQFQFKVFCPLYMQEMMLRCYHGSFSGSSLILPIGCEKTVFCNPLCVACFKTCYHMAEQHLDDLGQNGAEQLKA